MFLYVSGNRFPVLPGDKLTAQGFYRQDENKTQTVAAPYFFANGVNKDFPVIANSENSMTDASVSFTAGKYTISPIEFTVGDDGVMNLGVNSATASHWVVWDNFRLSYLGDPNAAEPADANEVVFEFADPMVGTLTQGTTGTSTTTVTVNSNMVNAIKFANSYIYADGKYITIAPSSGSFKKGDIVSIAGCIDKDDATKYAKPVIYAADGTTLLYEGENVVNLSGNPTAVPEVKTYTLTQDAEKLLVGRTGTTALYITTLKVERSASAEPAEEPGHVTLAAGTVDADNWKAKAGDATEFTTLPLEGVAEGTKVTLQYSGQKRVKSVKAVIKGAAAPATPTLLEFEPGGKKFYYYEGETWKQAIDNHPENAANGWRIDEDDETVSLLSTKIL